MLRHSEPYTREERLKNIPIVAMTASAIQGDKEKCQRAGMNDYLSKPVRGKVLEQMLVKWAIMGRDRRSHPMVLSSANAPHLSPTETQPTPHKPTRPGPSTLSHAENASHAATPSTTTQMPARSSAAAPAAPEQPGPPKLGDITMPDSNDSIVTQLQFDSSGDEGPNKHNNTFDNTNPANYTALGRSMETEGAGAQRRLWAEEKAMTLRDDKLMQISGQNRAEREDIHNEVADTEGDNDQEASNDRDGKTVTPRMLGGYFPPQSTPGPEDMHVDLTTPLTEKSEVSAGFSLSRGGIAASETSSTGTKAGSVGSGHKRLGLTRENMDALANEYRVRDESRRRGVSSGAGSASRGKGAGSLNGSGQPSGTADGVSQMD